MPRYIWIFVFDRRLCCLRNRSYMLLRPVQGGRNIYKVVEIQNTKTNTNTNRTTNTKRNTKYKCKYIKKYMEKYIKKNTCVYFCKTFKMGVGGRCKTFRCVKHKNIESSKCIKVRSQKTFNKLKFLCKLLYYII